MAEFILRTNFPLRRITCLRRVIHLPKTEPRLGINLCLDQLCG